MSELICYPGQGALPKEGFGKTIFEQPSSARDTLEFVLRYINISDTNANIQEIYVQGVDSNGNRIHDTRFCQPIQVAHSIAMEAHYIEQHPPTTPVVRAPHSLGQYSAMIAAGGFHENPQQNIAIGMNIVNIRARRTADQPEGSMAVVRCDESHEETLKQLCNQHSVSIAVINGPGFFTLSGAPEQMAALTEEFKRSRQFSSVPLTIERAFHDPSMKGVRRLIETDSYGLTFSPLEGRIILSTGQVTNNPELVWNEILNQLHTTFDWNTVRKTAIEDLGFKSGIEMGGDRIQGTERVNKKRGYTSLEIESITNI